MFAQKGFFLPSPPEKDQIPLENKNIHLSKLELQALEPVPNVSTLQVLFSNLPFRDK